MSHGSERRQSRRYQIQLPLLHKPLLSTPDGNWIGWTRDLSERGACAELDRSVSPPTHLLVRLQTDRGPIDGEAVVVWASEPLWPKGGVLHGLAFTQLAREHRQALLRVLLARRAGIRVPIEIAVTCQVKGRAEPPFQGQARNGSRDGLLLRLPQVVLPGTILEVSLHNRKGPLSAEGAVVWVAPPEGRTPGDLIQHGLRLTTLEWSTALALARDLVGPLEDTPWFAPREGNV